MNQPAESAYFNDRLSLLLGILTADLYALGSEPGQWVARRTRSGVTVSLTMGPDGLRRIRLSTEDRPEKGNLAAWDRWQGVIDLMRQHLWISRWREVEAEPGAGAAREFAEPGLAA